MSDALRILAVLGLVAGNAFFVIGEYAVVTARRGALSQRRGSAAALRLMDDPVRLRPSRSVSPRSASSPARWPSRWCAA